MLAPDINILVGAYRSDAENHPQLREWLMAALDGEESIGLSPLVLTGFVRVMSTPAFAKKEIRRVDTLGFVDSLLDARRTALLIPGHEAFRLFRRFCELPGLGSKVIADAYHAAIAIEHRCEWVTLDRDFARFPGLRWSMPV
jgi:toxin-antitoxin system PIN domain toxin